jgi:deoxyribonuclease-4
MSSRLRVSEAQSVLDNEHSIKERMRVRKVLDSLSSQDETALRKLLPKGVITDKSIAALPNGKFPSALHSVLPADQGYSIIGHVGEALLHVGAQDINVDLLISLVNEHALINDAAEAKIRKSVTTGAFLEAVRKTRLLLDPLFAAVEGDVVAEPTLEGGHVEGHPDLVVGLAEGPGAHIFEIKCAGQPKVSWSGFLYQSFAYAALLPTASKVSIVLPLQSHVWTYDLDGWPQKQREAYLACLEAAAEKAMTVGVSVAAAAAEVCDRCLVGSHVEKKEVMEKMMVDLDPARPWQIFLSGNMNSNVNIKPPVIKAVKAMVGEKEPKLYVHSPYLINLAATPGEKEDFHITCLNKCLDAAKEMGFRGVVVHVGKSVKLEVSQALENMRWAIEQVLPHASETCPLLLETPAGQGTELLTDLAEFVEFVTSFADRRIRICVDTCHVFATGYDPLEYIDYVLAVDPDLAGCGATRLDGSLAKPGNDLLRLVHFNDSETECGACVDRHASMGMGKIGFEKMAAIAERCFTEGVPALIE